jgi:hypothetical protein
MSKKRDLAKLPEWMRSAEAVGKLVGIGPDRVRSEVWAWNTTGGEVGLRRREVRRFHRDDVHDWMCRRKLAGLVARVVRGIRRLAASRKVHIGALRFRYTCLLLNLDHKKAARFYAHTHEPDAAGANAVCVHPDAAWLSLPQLAGIVVHEIGHVMSGEWEEQSSEPRADDWVRQHLGLEVLYDSADSLEYLDKTGMKALGL